jgi:hypothetical protein
VANHLFLTILPLVSTTPVANNGNNIRLLTTESELEEKKISLCEFYYPKVSVQRKYLKLFRWKRLSI